MVLAGDILDEDYIIFDETAEESRLSNISPELVLGVMAAPEPFEWYLDRYSMWEAAVSGIDQLQGKRGLDPAQGNSVEILGLQLRAWVDRDQELTKACGEYNVAHGDIAPYLNAHRDCAKLLGLCERSDCEQLLLLNGSWEVARQSLRFPRRDEPMVEARETVVRFVSTRMAARPYFRTLRQTIDFARSEEGWEYRQLIDQWAEAAMRDSDSAMLAIERSLAVMEQRHRLADAAKRWGRLATYCGPLTLGLSMFDVPGAVVGTAATMVGAAAQATSEILTRRIRWYSVSVLR